MPPSGTTAAWGLRMAFIFSENPRRGQRVSGRLCPHCTPPPWTVCAASVSFWKGRMCVEAGPGQLTWGAGGRAALCR